MNRDKKESYDPAFGRGFCVDPKKPLHRLYLIPRGMISGMAGKRAGAAELAMPLGNGPFWFGHVDIAERFEEGRAIREAQALDSMPDYALPLLRGLASPRPDFAGLKMDRAQIMGVINVTPDSFSDGGDYIDAKAAIEHGRRMIKAGADILDIGGESTRPGAKPVSIEEELRRVLPVIETLAEEGVLISIDTRHAEIMRRAVAAGARIINDVTALTGDSKSEEVAAKSKASIILMHMQGTPEIMQKNPTYKDVTCDLLDYFDQRIESLEKMGIERSRIAIDPGIGFGKNDAHNLMLLDEIAAFQVFGCPVVLGASRKSFIGRLSRGEGPKERLAGTLATHQCGLDRGVQILRVHDVAEAAQARSLWEHINGL